MSRGYMGKVLKVDLSQKTFKDYVLDEKMCRDYIGGYGLGCQADLGLAKGRHRPAGARKPTSVS